MENNEQRGEAEPTPGPSNESDMPLIEFRGNTYIQSTFEGCAAICDEMLKRIDKTDESIVPIGFDLEWLTYCYGTATNKTALAQLCISPRTCHLFHLYDIPKLPAAFTLLLKHPKVRLVGVNVTGDVRKLGRDFPGFPVQEIVENNCVECGTLANEYFGTSTRWSLAKLVNVLANKKLTKPVSVRKGKWHLFPLTEAQKAYAATDAFASLIVYMTLRVRLAQKAQNSR